MPGHNRQCQVGRQLPVQSEPRPDDCSEMRPRLASLTLTGVLGGLLGGCGGGSAGGGGAPDAADSRVDMGGALDGPRGDLPSAADVARRSPGRPGRRRGRARRQRSGRRPRRRGHPGRFGRQLRHPDRRPGPGRHDVRLLVQGVDLDRARSREPLLRRSALPAGVEQLHLARRVVLVRRRGRPVRRHLPGLGGERRESGPRGRLCVRELLRGVSSARRRVRRRRQFVLRRLALCRRLVRHVRVGRPDLHDDGRLLQRNVQERSVHRRPGWHLRVAGRLLAGRMPRRALPVRRRPDPRATPAA